MQDVYGFDMSPIRDEILQKAARQPQVLLVDQNHIITETATIKVCTLCLTTVRFSVCVCVCVYLKCEFLLEAGA